MAIDVGENCLSGTANSPGNYTLVDEGNPANATGTLDYLCFYTDDVAGIVDFASFSASGNDLTTNGVAQGLESVAGLNEYNAPGDFTAFNINIGEFLGIYTGTSQCRYSNTGNNIWFKEGDFIPCGSEAFTYGETGNCYHIYATGTEAGGEEISIIPRIAYYNRQLRN